MVRNMYVAGVCIVVVVAALSQLSPLAGSPMHRAASKGSATIVALLAQGGADHRKRDWMWRTPLCVAVERGHSHVVKALVAAGAERDMHCNWYSRGTALHVAAERGDSETLRELMSHGSKIDVQDGQGQTPLHAASRNGHSGAVKVLLSNAAYRNRDQMPRQEFLMASLRHAMNQHDTSGRTALGWAVENGHEDVVAVLVEAGADTTLPLRTDTPYRMYLTCATLLLAMLLAATTTMQKKFGPSLLHHAYHGHAKVVRALLTARVDTESTDSDGLTALQLAAYFGHDDVLKALLSAQANTEARNNDGATALHVAADRGFQRAVVMLIRAGCSVEARDCRGATPLHLAARAGREKVVQLLLAAGADKEALTANNLTPLLLATDYGKVEAVRVLLAAGANTEARDQDGKSPLHLAAFFSNSRKIMDALIEAGADLHCKDVEGATPLHVASYFGHAGCVQKLLRLGADVDIRDKGGKTPTHIAAERGHLEVIKLLDEQTDHRQCGGHDAPHGGALRASGRGQGAAGARFTAGGRP